MTTISGQAVTAEGLRPVELTIEGDRIVALAASDRARPNLILPGFIDLHCHGGGGADVMEGGDAARTAARLHARNGTTSFLATTMTAPAAEIEAALAAVAEAMRAPGEGEAAILGVHLEGPFISPDRLGAQPPFAITADLDLMARFCALAPIRVVTVAAEADPDGRLAAFLRARGIRAQLGHSSCDYETAAARFATDIDGTTHLFNAMTGLHHRAPGIVGAALAHLDHAELIPDLIHVHPGAIRAALRAIPSLYAITDASAAAGMPDGEYRLGQQVVRKCDNGVRLADGTLAGSCLTMAEAFRNLVSLGLTIEDAARRTATIQADYLGLTDRGRIAEGLRADLVVLTADLALEAVYVGGNAIAL
ncbi:MAG: N-acetylglucosamine-6-phosphate deacetylase [Bauldia sp.]|uniref:N-acetylglucosamine-6-phosphate deacetylase n=1 Tax=Bauldia sp. TaxID=2575872 RepID=UPI001D993263|nr:N-acetylglucosamine-6-phosphate deacetylase [Bauldia sp.]MCB1496093.1 N-acetylglucosamine-6-phosphate deacetylase [Bauldia sp.]